MKFLDDFKDKTVMLTGHTGFKGSWLSIWLSILGANIIALSRDVPTNPSHYELFDNIFSSDERVDLAELDKLSDLINLSKPDYIFHLAAQPIVLQSYLDPYETFCSNSIGTLNILESLRRSNHDCCAIIITSDKCYENIETQNQYKETDRLGGKDPYSASKGSAELIIRSYYESFFKDIKSNIRISSARAGNVMGGGDWAEHRIVPDCVKSWVSKKEVTLRNFNSTRPWQHVLEPLSGYLTLATALRENPKLNGESFNFGPNSTTSYTVGELVKELSKTWPDSRWTTDSAKKENFYEANLLSLNCNKAKKLLNWSPKLSFKETANWTGKWYYSYYFDGGKAAMQITKNQIHEYSQLL